MTNKVNKISIIIIAFILMVPTLHISGQNAAPTLRTVVIDPGHGGKDSGAPGPDKSHSEKHIVLNISKLLGDRIKKEYPSVKVVYTRSGDSYPTLTDRVKITHNSSADLFISIHCNANDSKSVSGSSAHILSRKDSRNPKRDLFHESVELTELENSFFESAEDLSIVRNSAEDQILSSLMFHSNFEHSVMLAQLVIDNLATKPFHKWSTGVHQNEFLLLRQITYTCPAILVECAFLSNPNERQLLVSDKWQKEIAERLFTAFKEYKTAYDASVTVPGSGTPEVSGPAAADSGSDKADEYFAVQIMGLGRLIQNGDPALKGLKIQAVKAEGSSIYKYVCGMHGSKEDAAAQLPAIRKKFPEAFVVKVEGNNVSRVK